jgi:hypothetical protein
LGSRRLAATILAGLVTLPTAVAAIVAAIASVGRRCTVGRVADDVDGDGIGEPLDGGCLGGMASGSDLHHFQDGMAADGGGVTGAGVEPINCHVRVLGCRRSIQQLGLRRCSAVDKFQAWAGIPRSSSSTLKSNEPRSAWASLHHGLKEREAGTSAAKEVVAGETVF